MDEAAWPQPGAILAERYQFEHRRIGSGVTETWTARDLRRNGAPVVIELFALGSPAPSQSNATLLEQGYAHGRTFAAYDSLPAGFAATQLASPPIASPFTAAHADVSPAPPSASPFSPSPPSPAPHSPSPFSPPPQSPPQSSQSPFGASPFGASPFGPVPQAHAAPRAPSSNSAGWLVAVVLLVLVVFAVGVKLVLQNLNSSHRSPDGTAHAPPFATTPGVPQLDSPRIPVGTSPSLGPASALVTIVEFSDFQCPFCVRVNAALDRVRARYGNDVRIVWKNNPLPFHTNAMPAAEAAMEAHAQGRFEAMHSMLFANQTALNRPDLERYAAMLGMDLARFRYALDSHIHMPAISADQALARTLGATGTPTFFVNGTMLRGAQPFERFERLIDAALAQARTIQPPQLAYSQMVASPIADPGGSVPPSPYAPPTPSRPTLDPSRIYNVPIAGAPALGTPDALVTIVAFGDFQCPFCARAEATLQALRMRYGRDLRIVWRNNPLAFHTNAMPAARLAMHAFYEQGNPGFWRMHDTLFANHSALDRTSLLTYAAAQGLEPTRAAQAIDLGARDAIIRADQALATTLGATGTPTFFVNGRPLVGAQPEAAFATVIDDMRFRAIRVIAGGVPRERVYEVTIARGAAAPGTFGATP